jgi:hypothetical protein
MSAILSVDDDFNGDDRSDILVRDPMGAIHFLDGTDAGGFTAGLTLNWANTATIVGTGDFNGDGRQDFLLGPAPTSNDSSLLISALQTVGAGFQPDWESAVTLPGGWHVVGAADFNNDGRTDILLRNDDGRVDEWLIGPPDATIVDVPDAPFRSSLVIDPGPAWKVAATGDFNGDGLGDILWHNDNGVLVDWLGKAGGGFTDNAGTFLVNAGAAWHVVGTGDFNGDGRDDILWRNDSGSLVDWLGQANGGFADNASNFLANPGAAWHVAAIGDFNGGGRDDILWVNDNHTYVDWLGQANGGFADNASNSLGVLDAQSYVAAPFIHDPFPIL